MSPRKLTRKFTKIKQKTNQNTHQPPSTSGNATITSLFNRQNSSVKCPACSKLVPKGVINDHLDNFCSSSSSNTQETIEITIDDTENEVKIEKNVEKLINETSPQRKRKSSDSQIVENSPKKMKTPEKNPNFYEKRPYYLENFTLVLKAVENHPDDGRLLDESDKNVIDLFYKLTVDAQKLYIRMFQRKIKWHQVSKVDYSEIKGDLSEIVDELTKNKFFVDGSEAIDLSSLLRLMQLNDLKLLLKKLNLSQWTNGNKSQMIDGLIEQCRKQKTLFCKSMDQVILKEATKIFGKCFKVNEEVRRTFVRVFLLFSLTSYIPNDEQKQQQQLFTLHLVNTNQLSFPDYSVLRSVDIFRNREDLIKYERMYEMELDMANAIEKGNWDRALEIYSSCSELYSAQSIENDDLHAHVLTLPNFLRQYSAGATLIRCLSHGVDVLERLRKYETAVEQLEKLLEQNDYHLDYRGRWTERLALNLEQHLKQPKKALEVIISGLNDAHIRGGHKLGLYQRITRICNSPKHVRLKKKLDKIEEIHVREIPKNIIEGRSLPSSSGFKSTFVTKDEDSTDVFMTSVEEFAIHHYKQNGFDEGIHGESATFSSLFCLLFWDIVYMSGIPDAFRSPHQIAPLDLNSDLFYRQRKSDVDEKLEWIRKANSSEIFDQIMTCWTLRNGQTSLVQWDLFRSLQHVETLTDCINGEILSKICERLVKDHRFTRSGFPDLVVWSTTTKKFKVVEVKGPNDRLSTKQILWLDFLLGIGVSAEVCHVTNGGMKKLKKGD